MHDFNFGENLRIVRQAKGISQEAMAISLGMSQAKYSRLEKQHSIPDPGLVEKTCKVFEVEASVLLSGREIADLVPKIEVEQQAKAIMNTRVGVVFYWILVIPFINAAYDMGNGFCEGLGTTDEVRKAVRFLTGLAAVMFTYYWMRRIQKGKG